MRKILLSFGLLFLSISLTACSTAFWGGTAGGIAGAGTGYELRAQQQLTKIKEDLDAGRMSQEEYNIRKDQIQKMSILAN